MPNFAQKRADFTVLNGERAGVKARHTAFIPRWAGAGDGDLLRTTTSFHFQTQAGLHQATGTLRPTER